MFTLHTLMTLYYQHHYTLPPVAVDQQRWELKAAGGGVSGLTSVALSSRLFWAPLPWSYCSQRCR